MILRRKKNKQKKAQKLQEAQQAFLASMQVQEGTAGGQVYIGDNGLRRLQNSAAMSVSTERIDEYDEVSGSDPDMDMDALSLALSEVHTASTGQQFYPRQHMLNGGHELIPQNYPTKGSPTPIATISPQQLLPSGTFSTNAAQNQLHTLHKRVMSQPAFVSIPTTVAEVPATTPIFTTQDYPQIQPKMNGNSGTLKRKKIAAAAPVISPEKSELITAAMSLGLGRGIDATDKMPWLHKKSFQVRRVHTNIIETNEGGILMSYNHEVESVAETEEKCLSSLNPPESAVIIHIEDELDRNVSSTRRIVGRRVVNRSIGFQADFEDKYRDGEIMRLTKGSFLLPKDPAEVISNTQASGNTFEERVSQWILHRLVHKCNVTLHRIDDSPVDQLVMLMESKIVPKIEEEIKSACQELVQSLRITHYVTGIQLGAAEYRIMSDGQYHKKMASEGAFGVDALATAFSKTRMKLTKKEATKCSQLRQIGKIDQESDRVAKGTQDEVVLQVQVQPITRLIKLPVLKLALKGAVESYMDGTPGTDGGPFVIKCTGRDLYLTVNKFNNYEVEATDIPTEASLFYFQTTDDGGNPFEFHIAYYGEDVDPNDQTSEGANICRYLEAPLNPQGRCPGPLLMKHSVKVKNTRFTLRSRLSKKSSKSHLQEWIAGEDAFYVACATKKYQHGSYLAVKTVNNTEFIGKHLYMTCCDPSIHNHNGESAFMLFQLTTRDGALNKSIRSGRGTPRKPLPLLNSVRDAAKEIDVKKEKSTDESKQAPQKSKT